MKVKNSQLIVGMLALSLAAVSGYAQSQPSAKVTAKVGYINVVDATTAGLNATNVHVTGWKTILQNNIKTANQKDLFINPSLEVGLYTDTLVSSKNGTSDTSSATAGVEVRVLVDGAPALPNTGDGGVVYGRRTQTLTAVFGGIITSACLAVDLTTGGVVIDPDCVTPEQLQLIIATMNANSFNFIKADVPSGVHTVEVQARLNVGASAQAGSAKAKALIGNGSVTIESVRMIKGEDITSLP